MCNELLETKKRTKKTKIKKKLVRFSEQKFGISCILVQRTVCDQISEQNI